MYSFRSQLWLLTTIIVLLMAIGLQVSAQESPLCVIHETCGRCLAANPDAAAPACGWCIDPGYDDTRRPRCISLRDQKAGSTGCTELYVPPVRDALLEDRETADFGVDGAADAVQIRPQRVRMALKRGETKTVRLTYRPARNYPLDLYYLMDMTHSMEDDKQTLHTVAGDLAATLQNLTAGNFRLGFGSFVDKPELPFIATGAGQRANPCAMAGGRCEPTIAFRNRLPLNRNVRLFVESVAAAGMSANLDNLEGGAEALMQVIVCDERIGWLRQSRKIVVFATDGGMHLAGDGLLAGVVRPNDGRCHLSAVSGEYEAALQQDYPSVAELVRELRARKVAVIFAATAEVRELYERLRALAPEVAAVGELRADSSNVLQLVAEGYAEFVRRVRFYDNAAPGVLRVRYETRCGGAEEEEEEAAGWRDGAGGCENVRVGGVYEFRVHVTRVDEAEEAEVALNSPSGTKSHLIRVEESSLSEESLQIEVELADECPCLQDSRQAEGELRAAAQCNGQGTFRCGMCLCAAGWLGKRCDCDATNLAGSSREVEHRCRLTAEAAAVAAVAGGGGLRVGALCSERGECACGQCLCNRGFKGAFCECELCPYFRGLECGGTDRATCDCGTCRCRPGWSGPRCDCATSTASCLAPGTTTSATSNATTTGDQEQQQQQQQLLCSGRGRCECGKCRCADHYYGAFCESSATQGSNALCSYYQPCVSCLIRAEEAAAAAAATSAASAPGANCARRSQLCASAEGAAFRVRWVPQLAGDQQQQQQQPQSAAICVLRLALGDSGHVCEHSFGYRVESGADQRQVSHLRIVRHECSEPLGAGVVGATVVVATFLVGFMALMAYKMVTVVQDRREFARFEAELRQTKYEVFESPLYKSPTRVYEVPALVRHSAGGGGINDDFEMNDM